MRPPALDQLSPEEALQVERACSRFEAAWQSDSERPDLETYLIGMTESVRSVLLAELLLVEIAYRRRRGESPALAEYLPRFPDREDVVRQVLIPADHVGTQPTRIGPSGQHPGTAVPNVAGYEVLGELGRGAMGVVYRARQVSLNREVALKMIRVEGGFGEDERRRFRLEAEVAARLRHPNIVQIYEIIETPGAAYLALEYCSGGSLHGLLREQPLGADEAARLVETLARAMHAAHQAGVVHRDLKPANVLLAACGLATDPGAKPQAAPKIADFGLARRLTDPSQTQSGAILGTPSYMAPEQARGKGKEAGPAADVYALGAILYECLTGRPPFKAATVWETLEQVLTLEPVPVRQLQPKCPRDLQIICHKCLRKEPQRRYSSAEALADDLGRFLAGEPIRARPVGSLERGMKWARRRPAAAALLGLIALVLVAGGAVAWGQWQQRTTADEAVLQNLAQANLLLEQARANPLDPTKYREALGAARRAADHTAASEPLRRQARELVAELQPEEAAVRKDQQLLTALLDVRGHTPAHGGMATLDDPILDENWATPFREWGLDVDLASTAEAAARLKQRPPAVRLEIAAALEEWAYERRRHSTPERWRRVADLAEALDDHPDPRGQQLRQIVERDRLRRDRAIGVLSAAMRPVPVPVVVPAGEDRDRLLDLVKQTDAATARIHDVVILARALHDAGDDVLAEQLLRATVRARPREVVVYHLLGVLLSGLPQPRWQEAVECYAAARAVRPDLGFSLGWALKMSGRVAESDALFEQMLKSAPENAYLQLVHGHRLAQEGRYPEAIDAYRRSLDLNPRQKTAHAHLGYALHAVGKVDEAIEACRQAIALDPEDAGARYNLARVLYDRGKLNEAIDAVRRAIELAPEHINARLNLGFYLENQGDLDAAESVYRKVIALEPGRADAHSALGNTLLARLDVDGAVNAYREAIKIDPKDVNYRLNLANALFDQGHYAAAGESYRQGLEMMPAQDGRRPMLEKWVRWSEKLLGLEQKLPKVLDGKEAPDDAVEVVALAQMCRHRKQWADATRLYAEAFRADEREKRHRYEAACCAAMAAGRDDLRAQGLAWLREELDARVRLADEGGAAGKKTLRELLARWRRDRRLAGVRDEKALGRLPEADAAAWRKFWQDVGSQIEAAEERP